MNYTRITKLPSVENLVNLYPLSSSGKQKIQQDREEIKQIIAGKDQRLLIIVGPCSAWPKSAVLEYARRLKIIEHQLKPALKLVMRTYIQKSRTITGWSGPMNQPDLFAAPDIESGMYYARDMMVKIVEMGLPIADECLFTHNARGFSELVSWFAIGARSSEDHEHRVVASAAQCAVGMKNPTHGSLKTAVNSVKAAQHQHVAAMEGYAIQTAGNPYAHLVLRGSHQQPNYALPFLENAQQHMSQQKIKNPAIIIDASHDNCMVNNVKKPQAQPDIIMNVINALKEHPDLRFLIKGFMLESFLKTGHQNIATCTAESIDMNGLSITDPCLGFDETQAFLFNLADRIPAVC